MAFVLLNYSIFPAGQTQYIVTTIARGETADHGGLNVPGNNDPIQKIYAT